MPTRDQIVATARQYIGTPFRHQGRQKLVGVDCVGLLVAVAHELGISNYDFTNYGREPVPGLMGKILRDHLIKINKADARKGDIVWIKMDVNPQHVAILTDKGMVHASSAIRRGKESGRVVEHRYTDRWRNRVFRAFSFPGMTD